MTDELNKLLADISELRAKYARSRKKAEKTLGELNLLLKQCPHPAEFVTEKSSYYDGDYYNRAHTKYWNQCSICGWCSVETTKMHQNYG